MVNAGPSWNGGGNFTGKVACSVPFFSHVLALTLRVWWPLDGRKECGLGSGMINSMRRVLHLRMDSQCAMLADFGIFLVLTGKVCDG
ncbi:hypothetical protein BDM02DRAFT_386781 [Thelephora ganbajun]|uniref:Uncharacterized protein n=1 Tax=Thelephora ganbajun TaxID=370292 RepID=A0ACB6Z838_THEGA|nr:hypothetical protein BDM02DRAFT_386781 [Thelephora ganbajun]